MTADPTPLLPHPADDSDPPYALDRKAVLAVLSAVETGDRDRVVALMDPMHPADIADLLEQINPPDRKRLLRLYDREFDGEILSELDESLREEVIEFLPADILSEALTELIATSRH